MTARDPNIEQDVRAIVKRIVDGLLKADADREVEDGDREVEDADQEVEGNGEEIRTGDGTASIKTIAIGGDHGGFALKERLAYKLRESGYSVNDCGTDSTDPVDYPDIAAAVARQVQGGQADIGIVVDGAGIGSAMAANKIDGVRAALCYDVSTARNAREHNHANVMTLGAGMIGDALAWQITQEFLATPYGGDRHARRVAKIADLERPQLERSQLDRSQLEPSRGER